MDVVLSDEIFSGPNITLYLDGEELQVDHNEVSAGLAAISVKKKGTKRKAQGSEQQDKIGSPLASRNSFWDIHRPELGKLNWQKNISCAQGIEKYFKDNAYKQTDIIAYMLEFLKTFKDDEICEFMFNSSTSVFEDEPEMKVRETSVQLSDEDLHDCNRIHRSNAEFCVTIGQKPLTNIMVTTSAVVTKSESENQKPKQCSLTVENEALLSHPHVLKKDESDQKKTSKKNEKNKSKTKNNEKNTVLKEKDKNIHQQGINLEPWAEGTQYIENISHDNIEYSSLVEGTDELREIHQENEQQKKDSKHTSDISLKNKERNKV